jgi:hypothetical protein
LALGPDEAWGAGLSLAGAERVGGWSWDGRVLSDASYDRRSLELGAGVLARVAGPLQLGVAVPLGVTSVEADGFAEVAYGPGNLAVQAVLLPAAVPLSDRVSVPSLRPYGGVDLRVPLAASLPGAFATVGSSSTSVGASIALEVGHVGGVAVLGGSARHEIHAGAWTGSVVITEAWRLHPSLDLTGTAALAFGEAWLRPEVGVGAIVRASARVRGIVRMETSPLLAGIGRAVDAEVRATAALIVTGARSSRDPDGPGS